MCTPSHPVTTTNLLVLAPVLDQATALEVPVLAAALPVLVLATPQVPVLILV